MQNRLLASAGRYPPLIPPVIIDRVAAPALLPAFAIEPYSTPHYFCIKANEDAAACSGVLGYKGREKVRSNRLGLVNAYHLSAATSQELTRFSAALGDYSKRLAFATDLTYVYADEATRRSSVRAI
ncbi:MAG: hypothetical protein AAF662_10820 [Pseudomonadota bacterium]